MEMNSFWKSFDLMLLALLISFLVVEYKSTEAETQVPSANMPAAQVSQQCHTNATSTVSVQMDTCAVLSCLHCSAKEFVMITWTIFPGDKTSCIIAYKNYNITKETNCSGTRINWKSGPERNFSLQIEPVTIHHEGYYQCDLVTPDGNFRSLYHLNVLVPPPVNLSEEENGTVVCKAAAGKPAAQISWVPKGDCFTEEKIHDNRTVTVKSTCTRNSFNASNISCFISHLTGNRTLYINHEVHSKTKGTHLSRVSRLQNIYFGSFLFFLCASWWDWFFIRNPVGAGNALNQKLLQELERMKWSHMPATQRRAIPSMIVGLR
ncbi:cell surface glycoprotein CD200 receptor 2-like isoform X1 [Sminthopsis crassicaudata]|uniref:cell surface glycoprotein CD200 receptor 2-like isoform X1 n=1 Tax=Sminthopsis crassicaudata TaxID=9301 RepID=UPI003D69DBDD